MPVTRWAGPQTGYGGSGSHFPTKERIMGWFARHPFFTINVITAILTAIYLYNLQNGR